MRRTLCRALELGAISGAGIEVLSDSLENIPRSFAAVQFLSPTSSRAIFWTRIPSWPVGHLREMTFHRKLPEIRLERGRERFIFHERF